MPGTPIDPSHLKPPGSGSVHVHNNAKLRAERMAELARAYDEEMRRLRGVLRATKKFISPAKDKQT